MRFRNLGSGPGLTPGSNRARLGSPFDSVKRWLGVAACCACFANGAGALGQEAGKSIVPRAGDASPAISPGQLQQLTGSVDGLLPEERVSMSVYENCNRGVVHIGTKSVAMDAFLRVSSSEGSGSGSVLDRDGMILTNHHVIDGAREISVSLFNGRSYQAQLVGLDPDTDIAVLKIDAPAEQLFPIGWGDSSNLRVGQRIYAIGNPFGLERTMSRGMISSLNRQISSGEGRTIRSLIQIDGSLNQGNSGGPLLGTGGQLLGMNTAIMSSDGDSAGVGFAIPVSTLRRIVPQLIRTGRVRRPAIGITRVYETDEGLLVVSLVKGGPAQQAGLQGFSVVTRTVVRGQFRSEEPTIDPSTADLIQAVDGNPVASADDLLAAIETRQPGDQVQLSVIRAGKIVVVFVTLAASE